MTKKEEVMNLINKKGLRLVWFENEYRVEFDDELYHVDSPISCSTYEADGFWLCIDDNDSNPFKSVSVWINDEVYEDAYLIQEDVDKLIEIMDQ